MVGEPSAGRRQDRDLIWARPQRAAKGPAPSKSQTEIAATAVALADAEGMDAVSMRKVGAALGIAAASMYGYVDSKDELYDLMVNWVEGEEGPPPRLTGDQHADLTTFANKLRASIHRHPWMANVAASRPNFGPNSMAWNEYCLAAMNHPEAGIDDLLVTSEILQAFVRGFASRELAEQQALLRSGSSGEERGRAVGSWVDSLLRSGEFPQLQRVVNDAQLPHADKRQNALFDMALERILEALAKRPRTAAVCKDSLGGAVI